jgi:hypothetical protein
VPRHVVHLDTTLGEQLLDIPVRQAEAQVPADGEHDDVTRGSGSRQRQIAEEELGECGGVSYRQSRCFDASPRMQQCRLTQRGPVTVLTREAVVDVDPTVVAAMCVRGAGSGPRCPDPGGR